MTSVVLQRLWPTIVGAMLLVAAAATLWWAGLDQQPAAVGRSTAPQDAAAGDPAADYRAYVSRLDGHSMSIELLVEGLRKLAGALGIVERNGPSVAVDLRVAAEHVLLNPDSPATTEAVRQSLLAAAGALDRGLAGSPLRPLAETIDGAAPLAQQGDALVRFFVRAAEILRDGKQRAS
jgi:hypothetical protein